MGSLTRRLRKHTTGLSAGAAKRIATNLSEHLMRQPLSDKAQADMQDKLRAMSATERVHTIAQSLSPTEIRRRLGMSHEEQIAAYGFALRGGVGVERSPAVSTEDAHQ